MISWTVLNFLASSFCHLFESFLYSVKSPFQDFHFPLSRRESPASSFDASNQSHCNVSLARNTLWLSIPAATDPVFLLAFLLQPPLETFSTIVLSQQKYSTFLARIVLFPSYAKAFHDAPFSPQTHTTATLSKACPPFASRDSLQHY